MVEVNIWCVGLLSDQCYSKTDIQMSEKYTNYLSIIIDVCNSTCIVSNNFLFFSTKFKSIPVEYT